MLFPHSNIWEVTMQQDADLLDTLRADLAELTALHAPSGSEQPVIACLRDLFAPLGGVQSRLLEGRAVWVGGHPGVIGARSGHLTPQEEQGRGVSIADLYVDLGVDDAASVEALGVRVGDPVVVISELRTLAGTRVSGKGIDNRASCVVLLHLLRRLKGQPLPCRLTALVAVQEEVGLRGATAAFARLQPDLAIVLDTFPAAGTPDTRHMAYNARIGQGVLITPASGSGDFGFLLTRAARDAIIAAAPRAGVPCQLALASGGVTDAAAAHLVAGGIATLELKIPRRYSHSPVELLDLRDLAAVLSLAQELVLHPPATGELSFLGTGEKKE